MNTGFDFMCRSLSTDICSSSMTMFTQLIRNQTKHLHLKRKVKIKPAIQNQCPCVSSFWINFNDIGLCTYTIHSYEWHLEKYKQRSSNGLL